MCADNDKDSCSLLDWITEPTPNLKVQNCGKLTQVTVFTNGVVSVKAFHCHRYDCPRCGNEQKAEIKKKIIDKSPIWYGKVISEIEYGAAQKRIKRAGEQYCALGMGDEILILTMAPVLNGSSMLALGKLESSIDEYLDCEYAYRKRRFRHSNGLFPSKPSSPITTHIKRKYAVGEPVKTMITKFVDKGYNISKEGKETFLVPMWMGHKEEEVLTASHLAWAES